MCSHIQFPGEPSLCLLSVASKPKLGVLSNLCCCQQFVLQPVVYSWPINLSNPGAGMSIAENSRISLGDGLAAAEKEAPAGVPVLLLVPTIRAAVGVLGHGARYQHGEEEDSHCESVIS